MISVSNIERFATHDGPGIRTTVFLKGCYLHCPWCANPETWFVKPVVMHKGELCEKCGRCEKLCPNGAISIGNHWQIDRSKCQGCGKCADYCLSSALSLSGRMMSEQAILTEVMKDLDYYRESNGGLTVSGGEPLYQKQGLKKLLRACRQAGLHIALETTGNYPLEDLKEIEDLVDLFLFDLKHVDERKLAEVTGADAALIFSNFSWLTQRRPQDVIVRIPVIPGFNDDALEAIISCAQSRKVSRIDLLPFHNLGRNKWQQLYLPYQYENEKSMSREILQKYVSDDVTIGG